MMYGFGVEVIDRFDKLVELVEYLAREKHVTYAKFYLRMALDDRWSMMREKYLERLDKLLRRHGYAIDPDLKKAILKGYY